MINYDVLDDSLHYADSEFRSIWMISPNEKQIFHWLDWESQLLIACINFFRLICWKTVRDKDDQQISSNELIGNSLLDTIYCSESSKSQATASFYMKTISVLKRNHSPLVSLSFIRIDQSLPIDPNCIRLTLLLRLNQTSATLGTFQSPICRQVELVDVSSLDLTWSDLFQQTEIESSLVLRFESIKLLQPSEIESSASFQSNSVDFLRAIETASLFLALSPVEQASPTDWMVDLSLSIRVGIVYLYWRITRNRLSPSKFIDGTSGSIRTSA